jgi:hypothetical protein
MQKNNLDEQLHKLVRFKRKPKFKQQMQQTQVKHSSKQDNRKQTEANARNQMTTMASYDWSLP